MIDSRSLDLDAVSAFVLVADLKSFTRAAAVLATTQSAISLRIKRLEDRLDRRLLDRTPRHVKLSPDGAAFLDVARALVAAHRQALESFDGARRRLKLGISDHLVGADLPLMLRALAFADPALAVTVRIAPSGVILSAFDSGTLDAAIVLRHDAVRRDGIPLCVEPFHWVAAPDFAATPPLRVATHAETCSVRSLALAALDRAGVAWTEAFTGGGLGAVAAAVSAGLAVSAMTRRTMPVGVTDVGSALELPPLPALDVAMHSSVSDPRTRRALHAIASHFDTDVRGLSAQPFSRPWRAPRGCREASDALSPGLKP